MLKNYFKTAIRNLWKNKFYSLINITGLAVGLATVLLILLFVLDELSYDRYNVHADRIYRVNNEVKFGGNHFDLAVAPALMGPTLVKEVPQVEQYTRLNGYGSFLVKKGNENLRETKVVWADSTLFQVFTLPLISGDPATALKEPNSIVITEEIARKYFNTTDVLGKTLIINDSNNYRITGVLKNIPPQSHFNFNFFVAASENTYSRDDNWLSENWNTYVLLKKGADPKKANADFNRVLLRHSEPVLRSVLNQGIEDFQKNGGFLGSSLTPLTDIHLHSNRVAELDANGSIQYVYIFSAIALFILLIACVNFMNLSTARSSNRAKEVGVRKVLGSLRGNLIRQFLSESVLLSFIALFIALGLAWLLIPYFNELAGKQVRMSIILQPFRLLILILFIMGVGLLAGSYPAFYLSAFKPIEVLKGRLARGFRSSWMRNSLVVFQFAISIILLVGTLVIFRQLTFIRNKDIGFNREQVLIIQNTDALQSQAKAFKTELLGLSGVQNLTLTGYLPVNGYRSNDAFFTSPALDQKSAISMQRWMVDENYVPTLGIKIIEGRNFSREFLSDSGGIIINEAAAKFLNSKELLNKKLYEIDDVKTKKLIERRIIGVMKNFNFSSLREVVTPLMLILNQSTGVMAVRIHSANIPEVIEQIRSKWRALAPGQPFDYSFMDEEFNNQYKTEQRTGRLFISFAILAILIACLGLFGLVTYAAEQRTREIGVRKVLGANTGNIVAMISREFLKLVIVAAFIAFPVSWWMMHQWLQDFAYRVGISWWIFLAAGAAAVLIALVTVGVQAIKAALQNPVISLRTE